MIYLCVLGGLGDAPPTSNLHYGAPYALLATFVPGLPSDFGHFHKHLISAVQFSHSVVLNVLLEIALNPQTVIQHNEISTIIRKAGSHHMFCRPYDLSGLCIEPKVRIGFVTMVAFRRYLNPRKI